MRNRRSTASKTIEKEKEKEKAKEKEPEKEKEKEPETPKDEPRKTPTISRLRRPTITCSPQLTPIAEMRQRFKGIQDHLKNLDEKINAAAQTPPPRARSAAPAKRAPIKVPRMPSPIRPVLPKKSTVLRASRATTTKAPTSNSLPPRQPSRDVAAQTTARPSAKPAPTRLASASRLTRAVDSLTLIGKRTESSIYRMRRPSVPRISSVSSVAAVMPNGCVARPVPRKVPSIAGELLANMSPKDRRAWTQPLPSDSTNPLQEAHKSLNSTKNEKTGQIVEASNIRLASKKVSQVAVPSQDSLEKKWARGDFKFISQLGKGGFGIVDKALALRGGMQVAIKSISLVWLIKNGALNLIKTEIAIQSELRHRNVIKLHGYFCDKDRLSIIMDVGEKGDLFDRIAKEERLDESLTARIVCQLSDALAYCHSKNVIHRDLKPENVLLDKADNALLSDFGWSTRVDNNEIRTTYCGTIDYMAPELARHLPYDKTVDTWALGVLCFECLDGRPPFTSGVPTHGRLNITFSNSHTNFARDLITQLVREDPKERLALEKVKDHMWIIEHAPDALLLTKSRPDLT